MKRCLLMLITLVLLSVAPLGAVDKPARWSGVDETVVEKFAREQGREARDPYINTDQGDLLLFLFALAGTVGGFIIGYGWHKLFVAGRHGNCRKN